MSEIKSIALFGCPHCIDDFAFDYEKVRNLGFRWRVMVRCPECGNVIEVVMRGYQLIHNCDPTAYKQGEIVEALPLQIRLAQSAEALERLLLRKPLQNKNSFHHTRSPSPNIAELFS